MSYIIIKAIKNILDFIPITNHIMNKSSGWSDYIIASILFTVILFNLVVLRHRLEALQIEAIHEESQKQNEEEARKQSEEDWENYSREEPSITSEQYYADLITTQNDSIDLSVLLLFLFTLAFITVLSYFIFKNLRNWWRYKLYNWKLKRKS